MAFRPIDAASFISAPHFVQANNAIGQLALGNQELGERQREHDDEEARRKTEFERTQKLQEDQFTEGVKQHQQAFDEQLKQHKQQSLQFAISQMLADPTKGAAYAPVLEAGGIHVVPKEDGTIEFIDAQGNLVAAPQQQAPQGPAMASTDMDGNPVQPKPTLPGAKPWDAPLLKAGTDMDGNPVQPAAAAPQAAAQQGQAPTSAVSANAPMPGESADAFLKRSAASMEGMTEDQKLAALEQAQNAPPPPDDPEPPQAEAAEAAQTPPGAPEQEIDPSQYKGTQDEEAAANQHIDRALSTGGPEAASGVPEASGDQHYANAAAKAEAIAQNVQTQTPVPGRSYGSIDLKAIQDHNVAGAQAIMNGFISGLPQGQDKEWANQVTKQAVTEFGINTPEKAMEAIKDPVFKYIIARGNQQAAMAAARGRAAGAGKGGSRGEVLDYEVGRKSIGTGIDTPEMKKIQITYDDNSKLETLAKSGKSNAISDSMLQRAFAKTMNSGALSEADAAAPEQYRTWADRAESILHKGLVGGLTPSERQEMLEVIQIGQDRALTALQNAYESEIEGIEMASPESVRNQYQHGVVRGLAERYGRYPFFEKDRVQRLAGVSGVGNASVSAGPKWTPQQTQHFLETGEAP